MTGVKFLGTASSAMLKKQSKNASKSAFKSVFQIWLLVNILAKWLLRYSPKILWNISYPKFFWEIPYKKYYKGVKMCTKITVYINSKGSDGPKPDIES